MIISPIFQNIFCRATSSSSSKHSLDTRDGTVEISSESTEEDSELNYQHILFEAYISIGEPDAVYGSGVSTDLKSRIHTYEQEKHRGKALSKFDKLVSLLFRRDINMY